MKTLKIIAFIIPLIINLNSCAKKDNTLIILKNGNIIDIKNDSIFKASVRIENGIITDIGEINESNLSSKTTVVDCSTKYILPGLFDMHTHIYEEENSFKHLDRLLMSGITAIRDMGGKADTIQLWKQHYKPSSIIPEIYFAGYTLDGEGSNDPHHYLVRDLADLQEVVEYLNQIEVDFIKVHDFFPNELLPELIEIANENKLRVAGHIPRGTNLEYAISNFSSIEHVTSILSALIYDPNNKTNTITDAFEKLDEPYIDSLSLAFIKNKTAFTPTLFVIKKGYKELINDSLQRRMSLRMYQKFEQITKRFAENGVTILAGSDVVPINDSNLRSFHEELISLSNAGIKNIDVLKYATINPATFLNIENQYGSIEIEKRGNLLVLNKNPLDDMENIKEVFLTIKEGQQIIRE